MTQAVAVSPEYVLRGLLNQHPVHGYVLHERIGQELGTIWHIQDSGLLHSADHFGMKPHFCRIACPSAEST